MLCGYDAIRCGMHVIGQIWIYNHVTSFDMRVCPNSGIAMHKLIGKNIVETMEWEKPYSDTRRRNIEEHRCPISWVECKCKLTVLPVCFHWR